MGLFHLNIVHIIVAVVFQVLILLLLVRIILSWLPLPPGNAFVRFFVNVTAPLLEPIEKRIPRVSAGFFDISGTVAFIFAIWVLATLEALIMQGLPAAL